MNANKFLLGFLESFLFHFSLFSVPTLLKLGVCSESFLRNFLNSFPRMFCGVWVFIDRQISISFFSIYDCMHNEVRPPHILRHGLEATNVKGVRILSTFETLENILLSYPFLVKIVFITIADIFHMTIVAYGP